MFRFLWKKKKDVESPQQVVQYQETALQAVTRLVEESTRSKNPLPRSLDMDDFLRQMGSE